MKKLTLAALLMIGLSATAQKNYPKADSTITVQSGGITMHITQADLKYVRSEIFHPDNVLGKIPANTKVIKNNSTADIIITILKERR